MQRTPPVFRGRLAAFIKSLVAAQRADDCVIRRGVESDDGRAGYLSAQVRRKENDPTRLPLTNQVTRCLPVSVEVIALT